MYYSEFDNHFLDGGICMEQSDEKILLYTGTLDARYGIMTLLRAFMMLKILVIGWSFAVTGILEIPF